MKKREKNKLFLSVIILILGLVLLILGNIFLKNIFVNNINAKVVQDAVVQDTSAENAVQQQEQKTIVEKVVDFFSLNWLFGKGESLSENIPIIAQSNMGNECSFPSCPSCSEAGFINPYKMTLSGIEPPLQGSSATHFLNCLALNKDFTLTYQGNFSYTPWQQPTVEDYYWTSDTIDMTTGLDCSLCGSAGYCNSGNKCSFPMKYFLIMGKNSCGASLIFADAELTPVEVLDQYYYIRAYIPFANNCNYFNVLNGTYGFGFQGWTSCDWGSGVGLNLQAANSGSNPVEDAVCGECLTCAGEGNKTCQINPSLEGTNCTSVDNKNGTCSNGECIAVSCTPDCNGKTCSDDDGCDGKCSGSCDDKEECTIDGCNIDGGGCQYVNVIDDTACTITISLSNPSLFSSSLQSPSIIKSAETSTEGVCKSGKCINPNEQCNPPKEKEGQTCTLSDKLYAVCKSGKCVERTCDNVYGKNTPGQNNNWINCGTDKTLGSMLCCNNATEKCCSGPRAWGLATKKAVCCLKKTSNDNEKCSAIGGLPTCIPKQCPADQKLCPEISQLEKNFASVCCPKDAVCMKTNTAQLHALYPTLFYCGKKECDSSNGEKQCPPLEKKSSELILTNSSEKGVYCCKSNELCVNAPQGQGDATFNYWKCLAIGIGPEFPFINPDYDKCPDNGTFSCKGVMRVRKPNPLTGNPFTDVPIAVCCKSGLESCTQQPNGLPVCRRNIKTVGNPTKTKSTSVYMIRTKNSDTFSLNGIAYIISPYINFTNDITLQLADYDANLYDTYKIDYHEAILDNCNKTLLSNISKTITSASDTVNLYNKIQLQIPADSVSSPIDLKIEEYDLYDCPVIGQADNTQNYFSYLSCENNSDCESCGDMICNYNETCSSCSEDCGTCAGVDTGGTSDIPSGGSTAGGGGGGGGSGSTSTKKINNTNKTTFTIVKDTTNKNIVNLIQNKENPSTLTEKIIKNNKIMPILVGLVIAVLIIGLMVLLFLNINRNVSKRNHNK